MRTYVYCLIAPTFVAGLAILLYAQDAAPQRTRGKVLLLKTGQAMEGDIEKVGSQLCVRRGKSEVWVPEDKALRLCADWDDAFNFAKAQIKEDSAADRVRLARWCSLNRLNDKALEQARIALQIQPNHSEARQMVALLERAMKDPAPAPAPKPIAFERPAEPAPTVDVSFETQVAFTTKVQPILLNLCATCHANGEGGKFHLERASETNHKASAQRNLGAVLAYIDLEHPAISPLLVKSITPHGGATVPSIRDRSAVPLQSMQQWIEQTVARNPQLKDYAKKQLQGKGMPDAKPATPTVRAVAPAPHENVVSQQVPRLEVDQKSPPKVQPVATPAPLTPVDEFDPLRFNMWAHPQQFRQQTANNRP